MKKVLFLVLVFTNSIFFAQTINDLFVNANTLYKDGKYQKAIDAYKRIETKNQVSSALYYNLGNCYYKLNKVAPTIYNYEKALKLNPLNQDAKNNLIFAKRLTLDRIEALPKSFLQKLEIKFLEKLSYNNWAIITVLFSFLGTILFLLYYFSEGSSKKRLYFTTSNISFLVLILTLSITFHQYNRSKTKKFAIIFSPKAEVKNAPTLNSDALFTLHEGTKIQLLDGVDNWKKIKLADGKIGWLIIDDLKEL